MNLSFLVGGTVGMQVPGPCLREPQSPLSFLPFSQTWEPLSSGKFFSTWCVCMSVCMCVCVCVCVMGMGEWIEEITISKYYLAEQYLE